MLKSRNEVEELQYDTQQGQWEEPKPSLFDWMDDIEELEPEPTPRVGTWHRIKGKDVFVESKTKKLGSAGGFQVTIEDK